MVCTGESVLYSHSKMIKIKKLVFIGYYDLTHKWYSNFAYCPNKNIFSTQENISGSGSKLKSCNAFSYYVSLVSFRTAPQTLLFITLSHLFCPFNLGFLNVSSLARCLLKVIFKGKVWKKFSLFLKACDTVTLQSSKYQTTA